MRPLSVTIVGWWLVVTSLFGVYASATMHSNPLAVQMAASSPIPLQAQAVFGMVNGIIFALCGVAVLKGWPWARVAFMGWSFVAFIVGILTIGLFLSALFSGLSVGIIMYFLSRRQADEWFGWQ